MVRTYRKRATVSGVPDTEPVFGVEEDFNPELREFVNDLRNQYTDHPQISALELYRFMRGHPIGRDPQDTLRQASNIAYVEGYAKKDDYWFQVQQLLDALREL